MLKITDETHFFNPKFDIKHHVKKTKPLHIKVYDKLFYTIYHKQHEADLFFNKYNESLEKIKVIEQLEQVSLNNKNKILEDILSPEIQLYSLNALCVLWQINIIWFSEYFYYEFIIDEHKPLCYLSNTYEWCDKMEGTRHKIQDIFKPLKSVSYYKLDELKEMANGMNVTGKTKKDYYDVIFAYFKHIKLI